MYEKHITKTYVTTIENYYMKTSKINFAKLRNEEHFQFQTEFKTLVISHGAHNLGIEAPFAQYITLYKQENEALQAIQKNATTDQLVEADDNRDNIFRSLADIINASKNHFNPGKRGAALRLTILFNQFGNVARKAYDEETVSIYKLVQELQGTFSADAHTLGITDWVEELNAKNKIFDTLMKRRYSEGATKTDLALREVRSSVDKTVRSITSLLDALIMVNGISSYEPFLREHNLKVEKFNNILAQRQVHTTTKAEKNQVQPELF